MDFLKKSCRRFPSTTSRHCLFLSMLHAWDGVYKKVCSDYCFFFSAQREREQTPHFAQPGTFEFEYASRWRALHEMEKQQREQVDKNIREAKEKLEAELESAKHEHQLMLMRQGSSAVTSCVCIIPRTAQNRNITISC